MTARDRGAVTLLVVILVPVVFIGVGALVIDVGRWYAYRAQNQNGSDAAAMAVAYSCAAGTCVPSKASPYAGTNANEGTSGATVQLVCGNGTGLNPCPAGAEKDATHPDHICPPKLSGHYVDVIVRALDSTSGSNQIPNFFGRQLGQNSEAIGACAQASWGPPSQLGSAVALTISACEWLRNTSGGTSFATIPSGSYGAPAPYYTSPPSYLATLNTRRNDPIYYDASLGGNFYVKSNLQDPHNPSLNAPIAGSETVITTHGFGNSCDAGHPGWAAPGQFGWLSKTTCQVPISGNTYTGATGNTPAPCGPIFDNSRTNKSPIYLPVYTSTTLNGANTVYTLDGFAAFVVTGWDVGGGVPQWNSGGSNVPVKMKSAIQLADNSPNSSLSSANKTKDADYCNTFTQKTGNSDVCIYGYFTKALIPASALPQGSSGGSGQDLGATAPFITG